MEIFHGPGNALVVVLVIDFHLAPVYELIHETLFLALGAQRAVGDEAQLGIALLHCRVDLVVLLVIDRTEVLVAYLDILQREGFGMSVLGALGSPSAVGGTNGIFDGVEQVVDIIVHVGLLVEEMTLVVAVHPFRAGHARRGDIHGIAAHVFA